MKINCCTGTGMDKEELISELESTTEQNVSGVAKQMANLSRM